MTGAERAELVAQLCERYPDRAAEVRQRIAMFPNKTRPAPHGGESDKPEQIGPYKILGKLGEGAWVLCTWLSRKNRCSAGSH